MLEVRSDCHFSARRHRLECLYFLIVGSSKVRIIILKWDVKSTLVFKEYFRSLFELPFLSCICDRMYLRTQNGKALASCWLI